MQNDPYLNLYSHIVLDEIHERDINSEFLLILLKRLINKRKDIKIILMSATINADLFSQYFNNCDVIKVPGRTFPVEMNYIEKIFRLIKYNNIIY